jgi:methionyl-tRNA formyltransferase
MNILVLGPSQSPISSFLQQNGYSVIEYADPLDINFLEENKFGFAISYRYRHIIKQETIDFLNGKIINLHISYLPWNRGADPNLWSFLEDTPKGVSIHYIDSGIDTGDIIVQRAISFDEHKHTLSSTYDILNQELINLFKKEWELIVKNENSRMKQAKGGSIHKTKDKDPYLYLLSDKGWDTPVLNLKGKALL